MKNNNNHEQHKQQKNHKRQPDRPRQPQSDLRPVSSEDLLRDPWVPGLVEVEFKSSSDSGVFDQDFEKALERPRPSDRWSDELLKILSENQMLAWKPSFPLTYPWSKKSKYDANDDAKDFYVKAGRDRFVTFQFLKKADVARIAAELRKAPEILRAKPVAKLVPPEINEPFLGGSDQVQMLPGGFENQWYAFRCNLPQALEHATGNNVIIAAIDWGFDRSHPDYADAIELRRNIYYNNQGVGCGNSIHHGTAVLGLAGARLNEHGMVGFAPNSILWAIQAGEDEVMHPDNWRAAIDFVREEPSPHRKVIILEAQTALRGNIEGIPSINLAIANAIAAGVVVCVPAGNGTGYAGLDDEGQPIPETGSILVGATSFHRERNVVSSNGGERIVVYAPGDQNHDLTCTSLPDRYTNHFGGTSGAVAKVAGAVALMLEANNSLTPAEIRDILRQSEIPVVNASYQRVGVLLDCEYAVSQCIERNEPERVLTKCSAML